MAGNLIFDRIVSMDHLYTEEVLRQCYGVMGKNGTGRVKISVLCVQRPQKVRGRDNMAQQVADI